MDTNEASTSERTNRNGADGEEPLSPEAKEIVAVLDDMIERFTNAF